MKKDKKKKRVKRNVTIFPIVNSVGTTLSNKIMICNEYLTMAREKESKAEKSSSRNINLVTPTIKEIRQSDIQRSAAKIVAEQKATNIRSSSGAKLIDEQNKVYETKIAEERKTLNKKKKSINSKIVIDDDGTGSSFTKLTDEPEWSDTEEIDEDGMPIVQLFETPTLQKKRKFDGSVEDIGT
jgi:hypothetical protein